jgi:hypothetical protein
MLLQCNMSFRAASTIVRAEARVVEGAHALPSVDVRYVRGHGTSQPTPRRAVSRGRVQSGAAKREGVDAAPRIWGVRREAVRASLDLRAPAVLR